jgi:hypothetical protein
VIPDTRKISATQPGTIARRLIAYQLESHATLEDAWGTEVLDAISGPSPVEIARAIYRAFSLEHPDRWVRVSTWDLSVFLRGLLLPVRPSTRLAWLQSLDNEHVQPHCQIIRAPPR